MADETTTITAPKDFAEMAIQTTRTDPDAPAKAAVEQRQEPPAKNVETSAATEARKVPDELFGGKKETKTETATETASEVDKIADIASSDKKISESWKTLKAQAKSEEKRANEFATKAVELEKRIAEFETKGKDSEALQTKLAKLEKEHAEAMELVRKVNVELTPEHQQLRTERKNRVESIKSLVGDAGGDAKSMEAALLLKGGDQIRAVAEVIGDLPTYVQGIIGAEIKELGNIDRTVDGMRSNPEEYMAKRQREMQEKEEASRAEFTRNAQMAYDHADKKMSSELEVLRPVDGLDWWNKQADAIKTNARRNFETNADPQVAAETCLRAEAMPVYRALFQDERVEHAKTKVEHENTKATLAERDSELKKLYGTSPGLRGTQSTTTQNGFRDFATRTIDSTKGQ